MDARIGQLIRDGKPIFYAFPRGYGQPPVEGNLAQVEMALGLRAGAKERKTAPAKRQLRKYLVTVTPSIVTYSGTHASDEYTLSMWAYSRSEAISKAREQRRENEGRYAVKATFKARLSLGD